MAVSAKLAELVRDATIGLSDREVCERTGLPLGTWRKLHDGHSANERTILQFTAGMEIDPEPLLQAIREVTGRPLRHDAIMAAALACTPLSLAGKRRVMQCYREELASRQQGRKAEAAA